MKRPSIVILAFAPIRRDARVLRQARHLARRYAVTVFAQADEAFEIAPGARVQPIPLPPPAPWAERAASLARLALGRLRPDAYEDQYWRYPIFRETLARLVAAEADAYLGNDWLALPIVAEAARARGVPFVLDLHEYAPRQFDQRRAWRWLRAPMIEHLLRRYAPRAAATVTVNEALAARYREEFGIDPLVVMSAPDRVDLPPFRACRPEAIRIIHHGLAEPERRIEAMIEALARAQPRYRLDLMLVGQQTRYLEHLRAQAARLAPERIRFLPPVAPEAIVPTIADYDVGLFILPPTSFNHAQALPNKLFDFIGAGLACCIGPSPEMARLIGEHDCGLVAPAFDPASVAAALDAWPPEEIDRLKRNARRAALRLNAETELAKLLAVFERFLPAEAAAG